MKSVVYFIIFLQHCFGCTCKVDEHNLFVNFHQPLPVRYMDTLVASWCLARGLSFDSLVSEKSFKTLPYLPYKVYCDSQFNYKFRVYFLNDYIKGKEVILTINFKF